MHQHSRMQMVGPNVAATHREATDESQAGQLLGTVRAHSAACHSFMGQS